MTETICPPMRSRNSRETRSGVMSGRMRATPPAYGSARERDERRPEEDDEQRGEDAQRERKEHEDRQTARARFGFVALGRAQRVGLNDEKRRERRPEPR